MKTLKCLIAIVLVVPMMAFTQETTYCFKATASVPNSVPSVLCLEKISLLNNDDQTLTISSLDNSFPPEMIITKFSRHTQERFAFVSEAIIVDESGPTHCSKSLTATLTVKGSSLMNTIYPEHLDVSVSIKDSNDVCHHDPMPEVVTYTLVK